MILAATWTAIAYGILFPPAELLIDHIENTLLK